MTTAMNMQQALAKMAANVAAPVKTAPGGQPKVAPAPGNSGNATSATGNPTVAPGPTAHSNATSANGKPKLDTAPEGGQKGKANEGLLAHTKSAGFAAGIYKAAAAAAADAEEMTLLSEINESGVPVEVLAAIETLEGAGFTVNIDGDKEAVEKVASIKKKLQAALVATGLAAGGGAHVANKIDAANKAGVTTKQLMSSNMWKR